MQEPFKHQLEGVKFLTTKRKAILADQMGLGKTLQAIMAANQISTRTLIICPASLKTNWERELLGFLDSHFIIAVAETNRYHVTRRGNEEKAKRFLIVNYDIINRPNVIQGIKDFEAETVILDEAHYIKNRKASRTAQAIAIAQKSKNTFLLTGTPILNRPEELFTLLVAIDHPLGEDWYKFVRRYCGAFYQKTRKKRFNEKTGEMEAISFLDVSGKSNLDELENWIRPVMLRRTKEILGAQLPQKIITNVEVDLSPIYRKKYIDVWREYLDYLRSNPVIFEGMKVNERLDKMENIMSARHIIELNKVKQVSSLAKVERIADDAENIIEQGEKIIIFTQYTETLKSFRDEFKKRKISAVTLSGQDDTGSRQVAIDQFQNNPKVKVFIGNIKAAGVGITLTEASAVMFADTEWTPALHEQAEDRAHRIGQHKLVNVYYYVAKSTIEEEIIDLLGKKNQVIQSLIDNKKDEVDDGYFSNEFIKNIQIKARQGTI